MDNNLPPDNNQPKNDLNINPPVPGMPEVPETTPTLPPIEPIKPTVDVNIPEPNQKPEEKPIQIGSLGNSSSFTSYSQEETSNSSSNKTNNKKGKKTKTIASVLGIILIIAALPLTVLLVKQRQEIRKEAVVGGGTYICGIQLGAPKNETIPSASNNGIYSIDVPISNNSGSTATIAFEKFYCACLDGEGEPVPGQCQNCKSEPGQITLNNGESQSIHIVAQQENKQVCGSFQLDLFIRSVNGDTRCYTK